MIDHFCILLRSGVVLFQKAFAPLVDAPIDTLIRDVLLEDRMGEESYTTGNYTLRWSVLPDAGVLIIVAYQKMLQLGYIDELLDLVGTEFSKMVSVVPRSKRCTMYPCAEFEPQFLKLLQQAEKRAQAARANRTQRTFKETKKYQQSKAGAQRLVQTGAKDEDDDEDSAASRSATSKAVSAAARHGYWPEEGDHGEAATEGAPADINKNIARLAAVRGRGGRSIAGARGRGRGGVRKADDKADDRAEKLVKKGKEARTWDGAAPGDSRQKLNHSDEAKAPTELSGEKLAKMKEAFGARATDQPVDLNAPVDDDDDEDEDEDDEGTENGVADDAAADDAAASVHTKTKRGGMFGLLRKLNISRPIDDEDLAPILAGLKDELMAKNVAEEIAVKLCDSVGSSLRGQKCASFTSVRSMAVAALEEALTRILTPRRRVDVLAEVAAANARQQPYVIVFLGVNGVGKSTSLSKVAYYLKSNGHSVMLCACDTFRSGAVEQLRVHAQCLDVPVFERGYGRDASGIAADGIGYAKQQGYDVVLVDTAGRMQDNEPLMRALAKLVNTNRPDLVLFVGEALVGNDSVDQVTKFNQALMDFANVKEPRLIDGMVLSKFDCVDDRVGAAISMVYVTGKPIVFVGVGQTYADIRNLNVKMVVKQLVK